VGEKPIQVKVMDAEGRRILLARAHGNITLGPLPAGEYRLQLRSGGNIEEHDMKLGSGKRGLLRYELGA
jgi:ABC-type phosphonate transport system ATPase subunit